jgi:pyruvate dehydrogenase E2 component (dihydrolipoamide acetyltransferase)
MSEITMPRLADGMEEGTIVAWLHADGARIAVGDELVEIETDKAAMAYEAEAAGYLQIVAEAGETLPVGATIARLHETAVESNGAVTSGDHGSVGEAITELAEPHMPMVAPLPDGNGTDVAATPLARRMAQMHNVALSQMQGTGPRGRITRSDVARAAGIELEPTAVREPASADPAAATSAKPAPAEGAKGAAQRQSLTRLQQTIARRMAESKATAPHFQVQAELDLGPAIALRRQLKEEDPGNAPSLNDFFVKAAALALREHPRANGSYRDGEFELYERINVGIAVAAQEALVVPVITDADARSLCSIAAESRRLAAAVRDGSVTPPDLAGGTFTVSNLGMYGMTAIFPVLNAGQAGILGVGAAKPTPVLEDGQLIERQLVTATLTCDHRILYGADAAEFLRDIKRNVEAPLRLAL